MKKSFVLLMAVGIYGLSVTAAVAGGDHLFVDKCGSCHKSGGEAAAVNPADKAGRVWQKYFKRGRHPVDTGISEGDTATIIEYLVDHAADSDQPAAAVIPK